MQAMTAQHDEVGNQTINTDGKCSTGQRVCGNAKQKRSYELALMLKHYYLGQLQNLSLVKCYVLIIII
jgi:hypothetical protein